MPFGNRARACIPLSTADMFPLVLRVRGALPDAATTAFVMGGQHATVDLA